MSRTPHDRFARRQHPTGSPSRLVAPGAVCLALAFALAANPLPAQTARPVVVKIEEGKADVSEPVGQVDPQVHIAYQYRHDQNFGLMVDGQRITYGPNGSTNNLMVRIDGNDMMYGSPPGLLTDRGVLFTGGPAGRKRHGSKSTWVVGKVTITQILEIVPSKIPPKSPPGQKRRLDTVLVRYIVENKDTQPHTVGLRPMIDMYVVNNDGALFASPTTHPNQILNGVELKDKQVPEYLQVLQVPNLQNPGFVAHFTFRIGRLIGPDRVVMTNLGAGGGWDIPAIQAGDSAIAFYFSPREVKAGGKIEYAYAHGQGIASNPESEGKVTLAFGGSFEPNKLFTVTAYVDDPVESQNLTLDLPAGMECVEGPTTQPVPPPSAAGTSLVLWKGRVLQPGRYPVRVHSSNGVTENRTIVISPAQSADKSNAGSR